MGALTSKQAPQVGEAAPRVHEESGAQRGLATCPRSHSQQETNPGRSAVHLTPAGPCSPEEAAWHPRHRFSSLPCSCSVPGHPQGFLGRQQRLTNAGGHVLVSLGAARVLW